MPEKRDDETDIKKLAQNSVTDIAVHEVRIGNLERDVGDIKADMKQVLAILNSAQGSWKMLVMVGGACSALGSLFGWVVGHLPIKPMVAIGALIMLTGCVGSNTREQSVSVETRQGIEAGQPTQMVIKRQESTEAESKAGVDVATAVTAAMAGFRGDLLGAMDKLKPQPINFSPMESKLDALTAAMTKPGEPVFPTGEVAGGGVAIAAALAAYLKSREAKQAREGHAGAQEQLKQALAALPPEEAKKLLS